MQFSISSLIKTDINEPSPGSLHFNNIILQGPLAHTQCAAHYYGKKGVVKKSETQPFITDHEQ